MSAIEFRASPVLGGGPPSPSRCRIPFWRRRADRGFAVIAHGGARTTKDIDLLIDAAPRKVARVRAALQILEDNAVKEVGDDDVARYSVVRVADEIVVDLMAKACGVDYAEASRDAVTMHFAGVPIPVASPETLLRVKNTVRPADAVHRQFFL